MCLVVGASASRAEDAPAYKLNLKPADGLPNGKDFCQHAMGGAFDEDKDGFGDDCDRCPIAAPRATPDTDGDMVDAPCDPAPTEPGDEILFFDGFGNGISAEWKPTTASVHRTATTGPAPAGRRREGSTKIRRLIGCPPPWGRTRRAARAAGGCG